MGDDFARADSGDVRVWRLGGRFVCGGGSPRAGAEHLAGAIAGRSDGDGDLPGRESRILVGAWRWWAGEFASRGCEGDVAAVWPGGGDGHQPARGDFLSGND